MKNHFFRKGGLAKMYFTVHSTKYTIREKYPNHSNIHKINNLVLIEEDKDKIKRNISVSNIYTFSHADFEGVEFYASRQYVHYPK